MIRKIILTTIALYGLAVFPSAPIMADEIKLRPAVLDFDLEKLETVGLYSDTNDGSLGRDLWTNSRRSEVVELLPLIPAPDKSPTQQALVMGALTTLADIDQLDDYRKVEDGKDIFTLRLQKLNEIGAYKQSFEMYSLIGAEPYHLNLATAGITALLMNGERSLACLEYKTMEDRDFDSEFWKNLTLYCRYVTASDQQKKDLKDSFSESSLGVLQNIAKNQKYKVSYSKNAFKDLSELERAILIADDRIIWPKISNQFLRSIPNYDVGIFLARKNLSIHERFMVMAYASKIGLTSPAMLKEFYTEIYDSELRQSDSPNNLGWMRIPYALHQARDSKDSDEQWQLINSVLPLAKTYGYQSLSPFADILKTIDWERQSDHSIEAGLRIINAAQNNLPGKLIKYYSKKKINSKFDRHVYFLTKLWDFQSSEITLEDPEIVRFFELYNKGAGLNYFKVIENVDKPKKNIHNADKFYVNEESLTLIDGYVMHMPRVWDRLINSSRHKRIGEAVLLSTAILHEQDLRDKDPNIVGDVLQTLSNVGLTKTSKNLVLEQVLDKL